MKSPACPHPNTAGEAAYGKSDTDIFDCILMNKRTYLRVQQPDRCVYYFKATVKYNPFTLKIWKTQVIIYKWRISFMKMRA